MKISLLTLLFVVLFGVTAYSQKAKIHFELTNDTIAASQGKETIKHVKIIVEQDAASTLKNMVVKIAMVKTKSNIEPGNLFIPQIIPYAIADLKKDLTIDVPVKILRDSVHDRILTLQLSATTDDTVKIKLDDEKKAISEIYIEPYKLSLNDDPSFEPLLFAGTNFDLLDGGKPKELYVKMNLFWKLNRKNYLQLGMYSNRTFSTPDSVGNAPFSSVFRTKKNITDTTLSSVSGTYSRKTTYTYQPIAIYFEYHRKLVDNNQVASIFVTGGMEIGIVKTTVKNQASNIVADTTVIKIPKGTFVQSPMVNNSFEFTRPNYLTYIGFMFLKDNDEFNVKFQLLAGFNNYWQPQFTSPSLSVYKVENVVYSASKLNVIIKKVGIGFGMEMLVRRGTPAVISATLSKVINLRDIKSLFNPISSIK
ncbi:MAG: hypothetical protein ABI113_13285 [Mucilaginibacter sp.]